MGYSQNIYIYIYIYERVGFWVRLSTINAWMKNIINKYIRKEYRKEKRITKGSNGFIGPL